LNTTGQLTFSATHDDYMNDVYEPGVYKVTIRGTAVKAAINLDNYFWLVLVDPCDPPSRLHSPATPSYIYTLTDAEADDHTFTLFEIEPSFCELDYTYNVKTFITDSQGNQASAVTDNQDGTFSFFYDADDSPLRPTPQNQNVTITGTTKSRYGAKNPYSLTNYFLVYFADPCFNADLITLTPATQTPPPEDDYSDTNIFFTYEAFTVEPAYCVPTVQCASVSPAYLPCQQLDEAG
jgi:hypothetical protein